MNTHLFTELTGVHYEPAEPTDYDASHLAPWNELQPLRRPPLLQIALPIIQAPQGNGNAHTMTTEDVGGVLVIAIAAVQQTMNSGHRVKILKAKNEKGQQMKEIDSNQKNVKSEPKKDKKD